MHIHMYIYYNDAMCEDYFNKFWEEVMATAN